MSMRVWHKKLAALVTLTLFIGAAYALPEIAEKTGQPCNLCHPEWPPRLGPAGEYYKEHGTMEGYEAEAGRCSTCHAELEPNPTPRPLDAAPPNHRFVFEHGGGRFWCFGCHDPVNRDKLRLLNGTTVGFDEYILVCSQCHEVVYHDWKDHLHGRWVGSWEEGGSRPDKGCIDCHYQHDPAFKPLKPMKPPEKPPERKELPNYPIYFSIVMVLSVGLALYAARR